jgi:hypothetical protein
MHHAGPALGRGDAGQQKTRRHPCGKEPQGARDRQTCSVGLPNHDEPTRSVPVGGVCCVLSCSHARTLVRPSDRTCVLGVHTPVWGGVLGGKVALFGVNRVVMWGDVGYGGAHAAPVAHRDPRMQPR